MSSTSRLRAEHGVAATELVLGIGGLAEVTVTGQGTARTVRGVGQAEN